MIYPMPSGAITMTVAYAPVTRYGQQMMNTGTASYLISGTANKLNLLTNRGAYAPQKGNTMFWGIMSILFVSAGATLLLTGADMWGRELHPILAVQFMVLGTVVLGASILFLTKAGER